MLFNRRMCSNMICKSNIVFLNNFLNFLYIRNCGISSAEKCGNFKRLTSYIEIVSLKLYTQTRSTFIANFTECHKKIYLTIITLIILPNIFFKYMLNDLFPIHFTGFSLNSRVYQILIL